MELSLEPSAGQATDPLLYAKLPLAKSAHRSISVGLVVALQGLTHCLPPEETLYPEMLGVEPFVCQPWILGSPIAFPTRLDVSPLIRLRSDPEKCF